MRCWKFQYLFRQLKKPVTNTAGISIVYRVIKFIWKNICCAFLKESGRDGTKRMPKAIQSISYVKNWKYFSFKSLWLNSKSVKCLVTTDTKKKRVRVHLSLCSKFQLTKCRWFKNKERCCIMFRWNSKQQHKRNKITSMLMFIFLLNKNYTFSGRYYEFGRKERASTMSSSYKSISQDQNMFLQLQIRINK